MAASFADAAAAVDRVLRQERAAGRAHAVVAEPPQQQQQQQQQQQKQPIFLDLSAGNERLAGDTDGSALEAYVVDVVQKAAGMLVYGCYDEDRVVYRRAVALFAGSASDERTVHLGVDIFAAAGTPVHAPLAGRVHSFRNNAGFLDYGPTLVLEHEVADTANPGSVVRFFTLYGHLSLADMAGWAVGHAVRPGDTIAHLGAPEENGNWPAHVHFQIMTDMQGEQGHFVGVCSRADRAKYIGNLVVNPAGILFP